uniref:Rab GDP dissociation inhibitor n=1 Tax=Arcella intermedia TaxID=1963864 RepID=A0A6B2L485_9EUKA|eukprot:TRINITY_DN3645_c0_g1_i1.p1 TRINITY_DN3645_c0_g1~~TRINITY_DN3645_c0_g1_i1.p1  ORF type:complete len:453 (+),score=65.70 TRINITY_DN3645_c0_g1_i1:33-1361(+)
MEEVYDVIVLGTGLTECIISGLLSVNGKKVLHMDRNDYYGGDCASLNLDQIWEHFKETGKPPEKLGPSRQYNIDLIPKFLMASGKLVKILLHTDVTRYLEFKSVEGSYVLKSSKINKVPATEQEALGTNLMGMFEKKRFRDFLMFVKDYDASNPKTYHGISPETTSDKLMEKFSLSEGVIDIVGHSLALYRDETWLREPSVNTIERIMLYFDSLSNYGKSPYLYPIYGLGDLPQAFARLSAVYGGTYMLNKPVLGFTYDETGRVNGVKCDDGVARCKTVVGDPSYFQEKVEKVGNVARCIAILDHAPQNTNNNESCQLILPLNQVKRKSDIYISCVSFAHNVAPKGKYICIISSVMETDDPKKDLDAGVKLLEPCLHKFYSVSPIYQPVNNSTKEGIHISKSYDATSHFETVCDDVVRLFKEITGEADVSYIYVPKKKEDQQ